MSVGEICNRDVIFTGKDCTVVEAARLMREHHVGTLAIVEDRRGLRVPVGIVTDRDLVIEVIAEEVELNAVAIGDIMSRDLLTANEADGLWDTLQRMRARGTRRVPVVNEQGALEGILALDDVLEYLVQELVQISQLISREQIKEIQTRA